MLADLLKLYKLIILYFLYRSEQEITNAILSDFILDNSYADYLSIQETLSSLAEDHMITPHKTLSSTYYTITEAGTETLEYFKYQLPKETKLQIEQYLKEKKMQIVKDTTLRVDYTKTEFGEYMMTGTVMDQKQTIFEIKLNLPTEEMAHEACKTFKNHETEIYAFLWKTLVSGEAEQREQAPRS